MTPYAGPFGLAPDQLECSGNGVAPVPSSVGTGTVTATIIERV